jgi:hypothetical protein
MSNKDRTGQQGNEIKTSVNKNVDLVSVEGLLEAPESFGNKTSGIDSLDIEIHNSITEVSLSLLELIFEVVSWSGLSNITQHQKSSRRGRKCTYI